MDLPGFREALLGCMERKTHWAWPRFTSGEVAKDLLHIHLEQEWELYVRDFPILSERAGVLEAMQLTVDSWRAYRDDVAAACGLSRDPA